MWNMSNVVDEVCERIVQTGLYGDVMNFLRWGTLSAEALNDPQETAKRELALVHLNILHNVARKDEKARDVIKHAKFLNVVHKFRGVTEYKVISSSLVYRTAGCCIRLWSHVKQKH